MSRRDEGFTFIEMMVATVVVMIISGGVISVVQSASTAMRTNAALLDSYNRTARAFQKIERHLRGASLSSMQTLPDGFETLQTLAPDDTVDNITFQTMVSPPGDLDSLPSLSGEISVFLQPLPGDPVNGVDDDGDGVIDGQHLMLERPGMNPERIAGGITSFSATVQGGELILSIATTTRQPDGGTVTELSNRTMEIRND